MLTYAYASAPRSWRFTDSSGQTHDVRVTGSLHANSGETLVAAAIAGLGIVCEPDFLVADAIAQGKLMRVLPGFRGYPAVTSGLFTRATGICR